MMQMSTLKCTGKLLKAMGLRKAELDSDPAPSQPLGAWHANLLWIEGKKGILFTHDATLLNFLVPSQSRATIRELSSLFQASLSTALRNERLDAEQRARVESEYQNLNYSGSTNRSVLGSMNDFAHAYKLLIAREGGLKQCDLIDITRRVNRMPMKAIGYQYAIEAFHKALGLDNTSSNLPKA